MIGNVFEIPTIENKHAEFELIDIIEYKNNKYGVFFPNGEDKADVIILRISDEKKFSLEVIEDRNEELKLFEIFKSKNKEKYNYESNMHIKINEVINIKNKEYICFNIITDNGIKYIYLISNFKPAEVLFAKEIEDNEEIKLEIINDADEKKYANQLLIKNS